MTGPMSAVEWAARRRRLSTWLIGAGPAVMLVGILLTAVTQVLAQGFFFAFQTAGLALFLCGLLTRYRADPAFAPLRLQDEETGADPPAPTNPLPPE